MHLIQKSLKPSLLFILPFVLLSVIEMIQRQGLGGYVQWAFDFKKEFLIGYLLAFGLLNIFFLFKWTYYISAFLVLLLLGGVGSYISILKLKFRGVPFLPFDLTLGKEAMNVSQYDEFFHPALIGVASAVLILCFVAIFYYFKKFHYHFKLHASVSILSLLIVVILFIEKPIDVKASFDIETITWDQVENYDRNGFLLGFALDIESFVPNEPKNYSKAKVEEILQNATVTNKVDTKIKPNIIYVMSEAFWDPTMMDNISFNQDPIPYFHELQQKHTSGVMFSPVYGGGTANTEFEALTGFSTKFLPSGTVAYDQYIDSPTSSMVNMLKQKGYETTAIHTFHNWFYKRNEVYNYLGFNKFISMEFFNKPQHEGIYLSDKEISKKIIAEIKNNSSPAFVHAVTMQAHGPYPVDKNPEQTIDVTGDLSKEAEDILESYSQSISYADEALKMLVEGIKEVNEPTILLFFGDHLPFLGEHYQVYKEAGYFTDGKTQVEYEKKHGVPFVIWDNISDSVENNSTEPLRVTPNFFSPYILNRVGFLQNNHYMTFLYHLYEQGLTVVPSEGEIIPKENTQVNEMLKDYKLIQYDRMFGEKYSYEDYVTNNPSFLLGVGKMTVNNMESVEEVQLEGQKHIIFRVMGNNLLEQSSVYINGEVFTPEYISDEELVITVPIDTLDDSAKKNHIWLELIDSIGKTIAKSNKFSF